MEAIREWGGNWQRRSRGGRRELASGSGSKVNKDPESLLRLGLPAIPKDLREVQVRATSMDGGEALGRSRVEYDHCI